MNWLHETIRTLLEEARPGWEFLTDSLRTRGVCEVDDDREILGYEFRIGKLLPKRLAPETVYCLFDLAAGTVWLSTRSRPDAERTLGRVWSLSAIRMEATAND